MNTCRTCLKTPANKDISDLEKGTKDDNIKYIDIMLFCLDIKVTEDSKITTNLCNNCFRKIISFYKFKALSQKNDAYLKSLHPDLRLVDRKLTVYVDEYGVKHENPLETDDYGPSLVECNADIKVEVNVKKENTFELEVEELKGEETVGDANYGDIGPFEDVVPHEEPLSVVQNINHEHFSRTKEKASNRKRQNGTNKKVKLCKGTNVQERQICEECGMSVLDLQAHSISHQPKEERRMLQCKACPKMFVTKGGRHRHYKIAHLGLKSKCDICNKEVISLSIHKLQMHNRSALPFCCVTCARRFVSQQALDMHMIIHTRDLAFECDVCHKKFRSKGHVSRHIRQVHVKEKNHQCEICSKAFFDKNMLQEHLGSHTTERPFQCSECGMSFSTKTTLRKHRIVHSDVKKYHCEYCDMSFKTNSYLKSHMIKHTKEKRYPCQYCDKRFGRSDYRRRHELTAHQKHLTAG
ncbi:gastrula zinc finger protein XlCGF46.1-like [Cydia pomonella]|uniref:gastrula zinc finger protein XlCGF46.1-like n=1 Tax=Cydia pomonella TaxID=82600 RepID=UPI002ADD47A9|nr:gastrula zinc finger protein XlCGF46.1-like [Cydia pomonella]